MRIRSSYGFFCLLTLILLSCTQRKKLVYFQGNITNSEANKSYNPVFQSNDLLSITVTGIDAETVKPFNLPVITSMGTSGYQQGSLPPPGYLVEPDGNIEFPLIGRVKIAGLARSAIIDSLKL